MDLTAIITWIIFGAIVGVIARFLMPGRDPMGWVATIVLGIVVFAAKSWYKTEKGHYLIDSMTLKLPILGQIMRKIAVARFTRTLGTLITSGVPILEGLSITARTSGNAVPISRASSVHMVDCAYGWSTSTSARASPAASSNS